jgi:DNA helicase-2/ATP-dependent DNA helicase PcrA
VTGLELTARQREVVEATEPMVLVLGGAGTGKTTVALRTARAALDAVSEPWQRVLFLTFSRTAVAQIAARASGALAGARERIDVATFHGFAYRLLRDFGRYAGMGTQLPELESKAQAKLFGRDHARLDYDQLVPAARSLLASKQLRDLIARRWPVVICDEFQDTSSSQWALLSELGERARLILLGDPHQMIYSTFVPGVGLERLADAHTKADRVIQLEPTSHRDPTGTVPALADAVRRRDFGHNAVGHAHATGRLRVHPGVRDGDLLDVIQSELSAARAQGARSFGIFGHSNVGVAGLGQLLADAEIAHVLVGLPEAQGEALVALAVLVGFGMGEKSVQDVRVALATFLTASSRGRQAPALALDLVNQRPLPSELTRRLIAFQAHLRDAADDGLASLAEAAANGWSNLGITAGDRPWRQAAAPFVARARQLTRTLSLSEGERFQLLERAVAEMRRGALIEDQSQRLPAVQLMNFHQTKGREADVVLLIYRDGDYLAHWNATEPYEDASRVLYVSLTRARRTVVVVLPPEPHPLVAPFAQWTSPPRQSST